MKLGRSEKALEEVWADLLLGEEFLPGLFLPLIVSEDGIDHHFDGFTQTFAGGQIGFAQDKDGGGAIPGREAIVARPRPSKQIGLPGYVDAAPIAGDVIDFVARIADEVGDDRADFGRFLILRIADDVNGGRQFSGGEG